MSRFAPAPDRVERFRADLEALTGEPPARLGIAVSGGADSLALLLLAAAAYPGRVEAATVNHALRPESAGEAEHVRAICEGLDTPHAALKLQWPDPPGGNLQARAREGRYAELSNWALDRNIPFLATAHHVDDQAETVLMRLARGSGVAGLAGTRRHAPLGRWDEWTVNVVRPLLDWRREELLEIVAAAGLTPILDPSNVDERFDRTRARALLAAQPSLTRERLAASASHLADAEEALAWTARDLFEKRHVVHSDGGVTLDATGLPRELQRRLLLKAFALLLGSTAPPGPKLAYLLDELSAGRGGTLAGLRVWPGETWRIDHAPPRRR